MQSKWMGVLRLGCGLAAVGWIWKRTDLGEQIQLKKGCMKLDDFPIGRGQWFYVDTVSHGWIKMDQNANLLSFSKPEEFRERGIDLDGLNILFSTSRSSSVVVQ